MQAWELALASGQAVEAVEALVLEQEVEEVVASLEIYLTCSEVEAEEAEEAEAEDLETCFQD